MVLALFRILFLITSVSVAALYATKIFSQNGDTVAMIVSTLAALAISLLIILIDIKTPKKKLSAVTGVFLGLIVGMIAAYALGTLIEAMANLYMVEGESVTGLKMVVGVICVFVAISLILQTKDDFRFVIPYVELSKQIRGTRPMLLDSSSLIDGRILDIVHTQFLQGLLVVPRFVLNELQTVADSHDKLKRAKGRRGLDVVAKLQNNPMVEVLIEDNDAEGATVDQKLISLSQDQHARLVTTDYNLNKVAKVRGVEVININDLASALRPVFLPGELVNVRIVKPGEASGQGVGYLDDGTMVVVEGAREQVGHEVGLVVTSVLQTSAGRMVFGRIGQGGDGELAKV